jgi:four helix bundle protein
MMAFSSFEDLEVWKRACNLAVTVYQTLKNSKDYGLRNQMQRAAISIASNVAEGTERPPKDFVRFLRMAKGSAAELRTQTYIAAKVGVITVEQMAQIVEETKGIARMLTGLARSLKTENRKPKTENRKPPFNALASCLPFDYPAPATAAPRWAKSRT